MMKEKRRTEKKKAESMSKADPDNASDSSNTSERGVKNEVRYQGVSELTLDCG